MGFFVQKDDHPNVTSFQVTRLDLFVSSRSHVQPWATEPRSRTASFHSMMGGMNAVTGDMNSTYTLGQEIWTISTLGQEIWILSTLGCESECTKSFWNRSYYNFERQFEFHYIEVNGGLCIFWFLEHYVFVILGAGHGSNLLYFRLTTWHVGNRRGSNKIEGLNVVDLMRSMYTVHPFLNHISSHFRYPVCADKITT